MKRTATPFFLLALAALAAYAFTSPTGVTWNHFGEDGAEFAAVGRVLGVAHPTGYPLYGLILRIASLGAVESAWRATLVTNLAAAAAVFLAGLLFFATARRAAPDSEPAERSRSTAILAALGLAAVFATGQLWWSQSNIIEVYALHIFFVALVLYLGVALEGRPRRFLLLAWIAGLGLTHHLQIVLAGPSLLILCLADRRRAAGAEPIDTGEMPAATPIRERNLWILAILLVILPVSLYLVLMVRSRFNPPLDWGNPETLKQLIWVMRGEQYRYRLFSATPVDFMERTRMVFGHLLPEQFGWTALPLGLLGIAILFRRRAFALLASLGLYLAIQIVFALNYSIPDPEAYFIPAVLVWCALSAAGAAVLVRAGRGGKPLAWAALALLLAGPAARVPGTWRAVSLRDDRDAEEYAREAVAFLPPKSLVMSDGDGRSFGLWYRAVTEQRNDLTIIYRALLVWPWYVDNLRAKDPALVIKPEGQPHREFQREILTDNLPLRPVYTTFSDPWLAENFNAAPEGRLFHVLGPRRILRPPDEPVRTIPVDLGEAANADYRFDPFRPGSRDSVGLYPGFAGGAIYWGSLPFRVRRPARTEGPWSVITTARRPPFSIRLPLAPDSTHMVCLLMDAGEVGRISMKLGEARILYRDGPPDRVEIQAGVNVWDYHAESREICLPEDVVAWNGPLDQSLTVLPIPTDPGRVPEFLELTGEGVPGESGEIAGYAVFGITQWLEPAGSPVATGGSP